jgi:hypothetical protein
MTATRVKRVDNSEAAIFARVWESNNQGLTPALARHVLKLRFSENDNRRMHELAVKNQSDGLSKEESDELDNFVKVGDLLAILQSKARILLGKKPTPANSHG